MNPRLNPRPRFARPALATVLAAAFAVLGAAPALAHGEGEAAAPAVDLAAVLGGDYDRVSGMLIQLAEAFPADKLGWRPAEGVRSVSEAVMHVADANFRLAASLGVALPEGLELEGLEAITDRDRVLATLKTSIEHAKQALAAAKGSDLDRKIQVFGFEMPAAQVLVILDTHAHEHLGQLIAYARSNGVTPPWSQGE
jgi:uncharacterized damage-inducible protein DinB